jgi:hypothetical protein
MDSLSLKEGVTLVESTKFPSLTQMLLDYLLRVSTKTKGFESLGIYRVTLSVVGSLYFTIYYKCLIFLCLSKGLGFYELPTYKTNQMIIGYFQSYRYLEGLEKSEFLSMLTLRDAGPDWLLWSNRAVQEKPIIVHIRLGDYLSESSFGIVTSTYISEALTKLSLEGDARSIWVFSDQEKLARSIFPTEFSARAVWVPEIDSNPMATLSIMNLGSGYVIANSTFSWWAAWSKQIPGARVYCPWPWFSGSETPSDLIPADWIQLDTNYKE